VAKRAYKAIDTKNQQSAAAQNPTKRQYYYLKHKPVNNQYKEKQHPL
jgi:hypothetical protein